MTKKKLKEQLEILVGIKKNAPENIPCAIEFSVGEKVIRKNDMFCDIVKEIHSLDINKTITIKYKEEYNLLFSEFRDKIRNIVFGHAAKHIEKRFTTNKIDSETIIITRHTNRIF